MAGLINSIRDGRFVPPSRPIKGGIRFGGFSPPPSRPGEDGAPPLFQFSNFTGDPANRPGSVFDRPINEQERLSQTLNNEVPGSLIGLNNAVSSIEQVGNRAGEQGAVNRADTLAVASAGRDTQQFNRATRGFDLTDRQKRSSSRRLGLSRALSRASAAGTVRRGFTDRQRIAKKAGGSFADALFAQRLDSETNLAAAFSAAEGARDVRKANKKSGLISAAGTVVGAAAAVFLSSESYKDNLGHEPELLAKLRKVRVNRWNYKGEGTEHIGPFSEEFNREFGIKTDRPDAISIIDALGVTLGAVKELDKKVSAYAR